ncbi:unnamed protein product [Spirodela intermedia]|uniref:Uncharacterized protein n=1 Tax=Spirodela intermedia TaxID=51605 RepID=A0A7I8JB48_SPIIN|nr:unnamed protein product [Spirodela intermedia]CAA6666702.1 unnamed protein product [Spirodela intermedia]
MTPLSCFPPNSSFFPESRTLYMWRYSREVCKCMDRM